jgi:aryl-alcohol dehydrogenase-like predicted oxidoreductase
MGKKLFIRSIFLQGLLLMRKKDIPGKMSFAKPVVEKIDKLSRDFGLSRQEMAIGYLKTQMPRAHIIFGAETAAQTRENIKAWQKEFPQSFCRKIRATFIDESEQLLNPARWPI